MLTSPQVLDLSSTGSDRAITENMQVAFLDEFRIVVLPDASDITELIVFNTLIPQGCPGNLHRRGLPQVFLHLKDGQIRVDYE